MQIGIMRELASGERRVALTPGAVRRLVEAGHTVYFEHAAGERSFYLDDEYLQAGGKQAFSSADPVSGSMTDPQSFNRYAYVLNDPCNLSDPLGLEAKCTLRIAISFMFPPHSRAQQKARREIQEIFDAAGVGVEFVTQGPIDFTLNIASTAQITARGGYVEPNAIGGIGVTSDAKGNPIAIANYGGVFQPELSLAVSKYTASPRALGRAMGRAGAHEIGHFLLNEIGHDAFSGNIMWTGYSVPYLIDLNASYLLRFTKPQAEFIQTRCKQLRGGGGGSDSGPGGYRLSFSYVSGWVWIPVLFFELGDGAWLGAWGLTYQTFLIGVLERSSPILINRN